MNIIAEEIEQLPEAEGPWTLLCETDTYDGPIGGFLEAHGEIYRFAWCLESSDPERSLFNEPRLFALQHVPESQRSELEAWIVCYDELGSEATVINNPHIYPVSDWQKAQMRTREELEKDFEAHEDRWATLPITHFMREGGRVLEPPAPDAVRYVSGGGMSGMRLFDISRETAARFETWQRDVASALAASDFAKLEELFADPPLPSAEKDIYRVRETLCDAHGRKLAPDFWMTGHHVVHDLSSFAPLSVDPQTGA